LYPNKNAAAFAPKNIHMMMHRTQNMRQKSEFRIASNISGGAFKITTSKQQLKFPSLNASHTPAQPLTSSICGTMTDNPSEQDEFETYSQLGGKFGASLIDKSAAEVTSQATTTRYSGTVAKTHQSAIQTEEF